MRGYWGKPEATAQTFSDGWLHTGDIARIDDEGFVFIVDRAKDMIIRGGENVYCAEVEARLFEHPAVLDAAVIGVPHQVLGEEVGAVVQLKPRWRATAEDIQAFVGERLAEFKVPVHIWFREQELRETLRGRCSSENCGTRSCRRRDPRCDLFGPPSSWRVEPVPSPGGVRWRKERRDDVALALADPQDDAKSGCTTLPTWRRPR